MVSELSAKRTSILDSIKKMQDELTQLNDEATAEADANARRIIELQQEVNALNALKTQNHNSLKAIKKILGE